MSAVNAPHILVSKKISYVICDLLCVMFDVWIILYSNSSVEDSVRPTT